MMHSVHIRGKKQNNFKMVKFFSAKFRSYNQFLGIRIVNIKTFS